MYHETTMQCTASLPLVDKVRVSLDVHSIRAELLGSSKDSLALLSFPDELCSASLRVLCSDTRTAKCDIISASMMFQH